jgi:hypothetical protein
MERSFEMDLAISYLDYELISREDLLEEPLAAHMNEHIKAQIAELKQAIAILNQHSAKVPAAPPELVRDYPNASD